MIPQNEETAIIEDEKTQTDDLSDIAIETEIEALEERLAMIKEVVDRRLAAAKSMVERLSRASDALKAMKKGSYVERAEGLRETFLRRKKQLTEKETQTLDFCRRYVETKGSFPTIREIAQVLGVAAANINHRLERMQAKGALQRVGAFHESRGWRLVEPTS